MPLVVRFTTRGHLLGERKKNRCEFVLYVYDLLLPLQDFFLSFLQDSSHPGVAAAQTLDLLLYQINQKGFVGCLSALLDRVAWLFGDKLGYPCSAVRTGHRIVERAIGN
jgi:hypothetical protein